MPRSDRTIAEFEAAAMLLGKSWSYDVFDHTFNHPNPGEPQAQILDADTMAPLVLKSSEYRKRSDMVRNGQLGAADAQEILTRINQMPFHGQDDTEATTPARGRTPRPC